MARALYRQDRLHIVGPLGHLRTSPTLVRDHCLRCGTRVLARRDPGIVAGVPLAVFDHPFPHHPSAHVYTASRPAWVVIADGLLAYPGAAPADATAPMKPADDGCGGAPGHPGGTSGDNAALPGPG